MERAEPFNVSDAAAPRHRRGRFVTIGHMRRSKKSANPFYALLVLAGLAFVVTATAYGVMAVRESRAAVTGKPAAEHVLMHWMHEHGNTALLSELALLGVATFGAIGTDSFWQRRAASRRQRETHP
jgi:cytochrome b